MPRDDLGGLAGLAADVVSTLGEIGVGALTLVENFFPPVPSEVVLPLAGYLSHRGRLDFLGLVVASTTGSLVGALLLYWAGAALGVERTAQMLGRVPLFQSDDVRRSVRWFERHETSAVLTGRLVPTFRSLVSLPAGAAHMSLGWFCLLTVVGSGAWNTGLLATGWLLGTQYKLVEQYSWVLDVAAVGGVVIALTLLVRRHLRRRRASRTQVA